MSSFWRQPPASQSVERMRWLRRMSRVGNAATLAVFTGFAIAYALPWYTVAFVAALTVVSEYSCLQLIRGAQRAERSVAATPRAVPPESRKGRAWIFVAITLVYSALGIAVFAAFGFLAFCAFVAGAWIALEAVSIVLRRRRS